MDMGFKGGRCGNFGGFGIDHLITYPTTGDAVPETKQPVYESQHSSLSNTEVKNAWSFTYNFLPATCHDIYSKEKCNMSYPSSLL
jgi:hypothetical protein